MRFEAMMMAAGLALASVSATAQETAQPCAAQDAALPKEMSGWSSKSDIATATGAQDLTKAELALGHAANLSLHHTREVQYAAQPAKPGGSVAYGGLAGLTVKDAGTYRIGLSSGAWIDVVKGDALTRSTAHGHGPACSTIRKIVDFPLQPGQYVIQISANADPAIALMVWRQP